MRRILTVFALLGAVCAASACSALKADPNKKAPVAVSAEVTATGTADARIAISAFGSPEVRVVGATLRGKDGGPGTGKARLSTDEPHAVLEGDWVLLPGSSQHPGDVLIVPSASPTPVGSKVVLDGKSGWFVPDAPSAPAASAAPCVPAAPPPGACAPGAFGGPSVCAPPPPQAAAPCAPAAPAPAAAPCAPKPAVEAPPLPAASPCAPGVAAAGPDTDWLTGRPCGTPVYVSCDGTPGGHRPWPEGELGHGLNRPPPYGEGRVEKVDGWSPFSDCGKPKVGDAVPTCPKGIPALIQGLLDIFSGRWF